MFRAMFLCLFLACLIPFLAPFFLFFGSGMSYVCNWRNSGLDYLSSPDLVCIYSQVRLKRCGVDKICTISF